MVESSRMKQGVIKDTRVARVQGRGLPRFTRFQLLVHAGALVPLLWLIWDYALGNLSVNPIQDVTVRTGKAALVLLVLSLAATPANTVFGFRQALKVRRALGLYAFLYVALHLLIYVGLDYRFDVELILLELVEKRYVIVGTSAFLILLPLAITSTKGWQRRLRKNWKRLHRGVYVAVVLAVVHFLWVVKALEWEPLIFAAVVGLLLVLRVPSVRRKASGLRSRLRTSYARRDSSSLRSSE